jgi:hypothetical protein
MGCGGWPGRSRARAGAYRRWGALGAGMVAAAALAACGSSGGGTTISTKGGTITVHRNGSSAQFSTPGVSGSVAGGGGAVAVPSGFPSSVPRPSGARLLYAETAQGSSGPSFDLIYSYASAGAASSGLAEYDAKLRDAGFTEQGSVAGTHTTLQGWRSATWAISIEVGPTGSTAASELGVTVSSRG